MKLLQKLHPVLDGTDSLPTSEEDPRPFLERIVETVHCPDILEDRGFWEAMNNDVLKGGKLLISQETETGTRVRIVTL
jgi:hypothetical protein